MSEEEMPDCPRCRNNKNVEVSLFLEKGTHYCRCLEGWFTPEAIERLLELGVSQEVARELLDALKLVVKEWKHTSPGDCYATGPCTGDLIKDYVSCPGCAVQKRIDNAIAKAEGRS